jgi:putative oxidoreductase
MLSDVARRRLAWGLAGVLAAVFLWQGIAKLAGTHAERAAFVDRWHYPLWSMYVVGVVELVGAGLVLVPRVRPHACVLLGALMLGALGTHLRVGEWSALPLPLTTLVLAVWAVVLERNRLLRRVGPASS